MLKVFQKYIVSSKMAQATGDPCLRRRKKKQQIGGEEGKKRREEGKSRKGGVDKGRGRGGKEQGGARLRGAVVTAAIRFQPGRIADACHPSP